MFGSTVLEVVIALVFLYLSLSLVCSALNEYYSALMSRRATHLRDSISLLFNKDDPRGLRFLLDFFSNPLISGLSRSKPILVPATARSEVSTAGLTWYQVLVVRLARSVRWVLAGVASWSDSLAGGMHWVAEVFRDPNGAVGEQAALRRELGKVTKSTPSYIPDRAFSGAIFAVLAGDLDAIRRLDREVTVQLAAIKGAVDPLIASDAGKALATALDEAEQTLKSKLQAAKSPEEVVDAAKVEFERLRALIPADNPAAEVALDRLTKAMDAVVAAGPRLPSTEQVRDHVWSTFEASILRLRGLIGQLAGTLRETLLAKLDEVAKGIGAAKGEPPMSLEQARAAAIGGFEAIRSTLDELKAEVDSSKVDEWLAKEVADLAASEGDLITIAKLRDAVEALPTSEVRSALLSMMDEVGDDLAKVRRNIEAWYNDSMEGVSAWYKRNTQVILAVLALAVCVTMNADTIAVAEKLWADSTLRANVNALARAAEPNALAAKPPVGWSEATDQLLKQTGLPLGWTDADRARIGLADVKYVPPDELKDPGWKERARFRKVLGLLLTAIAVSMGAPFWFDILNKLVNVRTSGLQPQKSTDKPAVTTPAPRA